MTVSELVAAFGGQSELARLLGMTRSNVHVWCRDNQIPGYLFATIVPLAGEKGIDVPMELFRLERKPDRRREKHGATEAAE